MNPEQLSPGNKIKIKIRTFTAISLHKRRSPSLHPTHVLHYYPDTKELFLLRIQQDKPPVWLEKQRTRGNVFFQ